MSVARPDSPTDPPAAIKRLGQNFLIDPNIVRKIVALADIAPNDHVLEIGPGRGVLTDVLCKTAGRVTAVEIDPRLHDYLAERRAEFPNLTLVGVIDADRGLDGGDLRAAERTFQQISQVAGRAGRASKRGHVFIQTHSPDAPVMQALVTGDADAFYAAETEARRFANAPPFGRYAAIVVSSEDKEAAQDTARVIKHQAPDVDGMSVYGPAPAPLAMLRGRQIGRAHV